MWKRASARRTSIWGTSAADFTRRSFCRQTASKYSAGPGYLATRCLPLSRPPVSPSSSRACASPTGRSGPSTASTSPSPPAPSSACSGPTGRARPRRCASSPPCWRPDEGRAVVAGFDVVKEPGEGAVGDRPGRAVRGGRRDPHRPGEPGAGGPALPPGQGRGRPPGGRGARALRPGGGRRPPGGHLLGGHAPAPRPGRQPGRPAPGALPRRAHVGARPPQPHRAVGDHGRAGRRRAPPCSSPPSTWRRPTAWPTPSPSSTTAG